MDNLPPSIFPPSPPSFFYHAGHPVIEFASFEVPEQWLLELDDVVVAKNEGYDDVDDLWPVGSSLSPVPALSEQPLPPQPPPPQQQELSIQQLSVTAPAQQRHGTKRRGRKPGPRPYSPTVSHAEAERQRREKLNSRFCDLRAAVPTVSGMDKVSLLSDATAYIAELRARIARLEAESRQAAKARWEPKAAASGSRRRRAGGGADTTGGWRFPECLMHSEKRQKHSGKASPSVALGEELTGNLVTVKSSSPSAKKTCTQGRLPRVPSQHSGKN